MSDNVLNRPENPSVNNGKGGSWPSYMPCQNKLGGVADDSRTTRTGVGVGRGYTGSRIMYSSSSSSFSSSSSSSSSSSG